MSDSPTKLIDRIFDARYPSFDANVFKALASAGVGSFPSHIADDQLEVALEALRAAFDEWPLPLDDAWSLFADPQERGLQRDIIESSIKALPLELQSREVIRQFLLVASNFNDHLWKLLDEDNHDELRRLDLPNQQRLTAARKAEGAKQDFYRFFNSTTATADLSVWAKRWPWTLEQATALSFGKNPDVVNSGSLAKLITPKFNSPFIESFNARLSLFMAAAARGDIGQSISPTDWFTLSELGDFTFPTELATDIKPSTIRPAVGTRESTYQKILLGLAVYHYGYDTMQTKDSGSSAYTAIRDHLKLVGIEMDSDTIKTALLKAIAWARDADLTVKRRPGQK